MHATTHVEVRTSLGKSSLLEIELGLSSMVASPLSSRVIAQAHIFPYFNPLFTCHLYFHRFLYTFMCARGPICRYVYINAGVQRNQNIDSYPLELELPSGVSYLTWVLGNELGPLCQSIKHSSVPSQLYSTISSLQVFSSAFFPLHVYFGMNRIFQQMKNQSFFY